MINLDRKKVKNCIILLIIIYALSPMLYYSFWWTTAWLSGTNPQWQDKIKDGYNKLSSEVLITKIKSYNNPYHPGSFAPHSSIALNILVERKEKKAVPTILKFINFWEKGRRQTAIWALGIIGDPRAIEPLMKIVKKSEKHLDYRTALSALSHMKYEGAFSYIAEIAKKPYPKNCGAISLLKEFGKPESITLLQEIKGTIKDGTPHAKLYKSSIDDAIKHIESLQKNK